MPTLEAALSEAMQGSLSNELDEADFQRCSGRAEWTVRASDERKRGGGRRDLHDWHRVVSRRWWTGGTPTTLADVRAVIGSKTFALYAGVFANTNKGDVSLFDYLTRMLGSIRVSDRVPGVSSSAQKGIVVLSASAEMPKIHVWDAMQDCPRSLLRRGRWQGHDHRDGAGQPALHSARDVTGQGSAPRS